MFKGSYPGPAQLAAILCYSIETLLYIFIISNRKHYSKVHYTSSPGPISMLPGHFGIERVMAIKEKLRLAQATHIYLEGFGPPQVGQQLQV